MPFEIKIADRNIGFILLETSKNFCKNRNYIVIFTRKPYTLSLRDSKPSRSKGRAGLSLARHGGSDHSKFLLHLSSVRLNKPQATVKILREHRNFVRFFRFLLLF